MSIFADIQSTFTRRDNALNKLLLINVLVFVVLVVLGAVLHLSGAGDAYAVVLRQLAVPSDLPSLIRHPWTLLTYAFTHEGFFHILFNLLNLYWFGMLVREYLGDRRLISLYILGGLAGAALFLLSFNLIPVLQPQVGLPMIGASGAVTAIVVAAATLLPDYTFSLILIGPVRIKYLAAVLVLVSVAGVNSANPGGQIAHLGGALLGYVFVRQLQRGRDLGRPVLAVGDWISSLLHGRPHLRVSHRNPADAPAPAAGKRPPLAQPAQEEIDRILDKISRSGYESLSKEEKQKLFKASQQ